MTSKENGPCAPVTSKPCRILLLTNRDSDNCGDQVIEACDIALIKTVMKNLGIEEYSISSRAAGIIPKKYMQTKDESLLSNAYEAISKADVVIFGGAPLFNYDHQVFYERTARTLEIAQELGVPVIFSAIGIEGYDEDNRKCQRLRKTLNFDVVRQITTRDDFDSLSRYIDDTGKTPIAKVSDPAVLAEPVFRNFTARERKRVGIFIIRAYAFKDNGIDFPPEKAAQLWVDLISELEARSIDYELITSGHFSDEAFLDRLIREHGVDANRCVFNMNTPEMLVEKISSYHTVVSCRLHPSIISYALGVPSVGIVWNSKVDFFYGATGHPDRSLAIDALTAEGLADKIEEVQAEGAERDTDYMMSVYTSLFDGLRRTLRSEKADLEPYSYQQLVDNIPAFKGTSEKEARLKLERKFRRAYNAYNGLSRKSATLREESRRIKQSKAYKLARKAGDILGKAKR